MEIMGMTDNQWKDNLRCQLEDWEDVEELLKSGKTEEALKKIERVKNRINKGLEDQNIINKETRGGRACHRSSDQ